MKVTAEPIEQSQVVLDIEVEPERLSKAEQQAAARLANQVNIPGFRRGKAPRHIVEMMVGREAIREEALEKLVPAIYTEAVKEAGIDPIEQPDFDIVSQEPLHIKATVPVRPRFELGSYRDLRIEPETVEADEERVEQILQGSRERYAEFTPVERPAEAGDRVTIDVNGRSGEMRLLDRENFDYDLDPESQFPAPGFAEALVGMSAGDEKEFTLEYPADYRVEGLAGKPAEFTVKLHAVRSKHLPELDDELAKTVGADSLEAWREVTRESLREQAQRRADEAYERKVLEAVVESTPIELPPKVVEKAVDEMVERIQERVRTGQVTLDQYMEYQRKSPDELREESRPVAERDLKTELILHEIAEREGITVAEEEIANMVAGLAAVLARGDERELERRRRDLSNPRTRSRLAHDILENKVRQRLIAIARGETEAMPGDDTTAQTTDEAAETAMSETLGEATAPAGAEGAGLQERASS